jgi:hypothetical protein
METVGLFGRYHRLIRDLAAPGCRIEGRRGKLQRVLQSLDDDCRKLSRARSRLLRQELSSQIEQELLRCTDPDQAAVLALALKHLDAD